MLSDEQIRAHWNNYSPTKGIESFARAIEAEVRAQALSEAYDLLFDVKGCKATRFDAQNAIRAMAAPVDAKAWIALARARQQEPRP